MEVAGLAVGVAGLAGTFSACADFFNLVRTSHHLGEEYETYQAQLNLTWLRFSRWGESVQVFQGSEDEVEARLKSMLGAPDEELAAIKGALAEILRLFEHAAANSKRMASRSWKNRPTLDEHKEGKKKAAAALGKWARDRAVNRQKRSTVLQKAAWAIYTKTEFAALVQSLNSLVSELVELIPAQKQFQVELCRQEVSELPDNESLACLDDILKSADDDDDESTAPPDSYLRDIVNREVEKKGLQTAATWKKNKVGEGSKILQGDRTAIGYRGQMRHGAASYHAENNEFGKNVDFQQGNRYG